MIGDFINPKYGFRPFATSLLFKLMGDAAGLKVALVRGVSFGDGNAWNLIQVSGETYGHLQRQELYGYRTFCKPITSRFRDKPVVVAQVGPQEAISLKDVYSIKLNKPGLPNYRDVNGKTLYPPPF